MRKALYISLLLLLSTTHYSQYEVGQLDFTRYGIGDGLPNMSMRVIGQDSTGYIWLSDPLTRFDGTTFKTISLSDESSSSGYINAMSMSDDGQGNIVFSGKEGIYHYNSRSQQVKKLPSYSCNTLSRRIFHSEPNIFWDLCRNNLVKIDLRSRDTTLYRLPHFDHNNNSGINHGSSFLWIWQIDKENRCGRYDLTDMSLEEFGLDFYDTNHWWNYGFGENGEVFLLSTSGLYLLDDQERTFKQVFDSREFLEDKTQRFDLRTESRYYGDSCIWFVDPVLDKVNRFDFTNNELHSLPYGSDKVLTRRIYDKYNAIEMDEGVLLSGSHNSGLLEVDVFGQKIHQYKADKNNPNSLISNHVVAELKTDDQTYFLCGSRQGLIKAERNKKQLQHYTFPPANSKGNNYNNIRSIIGYKDEILVTSIQASYLFDPEDGSLSAFQFPKDFPESWNYMGIDAVAKDSSDNLLVVFWSIKNSIIFNYLDFENNRTVPLHDYIPDVTFFNSNTLFIDRNNNYWVPTSREIIRIPAEDLKNNSLETVHKQWQRFDLAGELKLQDDAITTFAIEEENDNIWVGTSSGLFRINTKNLKIDYFENRSDEPNSLSHNNIRGIKYTSKGDLWVTTAGGGLNRFVFENETFDHFNVNDGLPDNVIYSVEEDLDGNLWLGTNKGLCKFNPQSKVCKTYTPEDGAQDYDYNTDAVYRSAKGQLYFGGINGFNRIDPKIINADSVHQNLVFSSFKINDIESPIPVSKINLNHDQNFIKFQFNLLDYYQTDKIQYAYMMEGLESDWNYSNNRNEAIYPGLNPGQYTFKVKAANSDGQWSNQILEKEISIFKPWYNRWWFYLFSFITTGGIAYAFYHNRKQQKERIIELRYKISQDLHDEIGSTLSSISLFGTVAQKMVDSDQEGTKNILDRINDSTTNVMESMNDIVWAINSENDKVNDLMKRMRAYISEMSSASAITVNLQIDEAIKNSTLNMIQKRNVYLIFKEAVNNAFKYSMAKSINVNLEENNANLVLSIVDDGIGFNKVEINNQSSLGGNGLINIKRRANEMKGLLTINSEKNNGTEIRFEWNPKLSHN